MSAGAEKDYTDNPEKTAWRRWWWNRIAQRIDCDPADALVVGLFGRDGLDIRVAKVRGFRPENMISVDVSLNAVKAQRALGINAIQGRLSDVLARWSGPLINVGLFDFCGGMIGEQERCLRAAVRHYWIFDGCIAANFLRGRDHGIGTLYADAFHEVYRKRNAVKGFLKQPEISPRHRGAIAFHHLALLFDHDFPRTTPYPLDPSGNRGTFTSFYPGAQFDPQDGDIANYLVNGFAELKQVARTYNSGKQCFDSVIFRWAPTASLEGKNRFLADKLTYNEIEFDRGDYCDQFIKILRGLDQEYVYRAARWFSRFGFRRPMRRWYLEDADFRKQSRLSLEKPLVEKKIDRRIAAALANRTRRLR